MGHFPTNFRSSLAPKLLIGLKISRRSQKWYEHPLSSCKVWWRSTAARQREVQKLGVFVFVCLFVTIWILNRGLVIQTAILSPLVGQFWCGFQHSLEEEMLFQTREICTIRQCGATFVWEYGQNLNFSQNSKGTIVRTTSTIQEKEGKNSTTAY